MSKVDFHNHWTTKSRVLSPEYVPQITLKALGNGGIVGLVNYGDRRYEAFCENINSMSDEDPIKRRYSDLENALVYDDGQNKVMILKGQEVKTSDGDLLVMALTKNTHLKHERSLEDTCKEAKDQNGVIILTTPYFRSRVGQTMEENPKLWKYIDAIEVHNGNWIGGSKNKETRNLYFNYIKDREDFEAIGLIASSDGHSHAEVGKSHSEIKGIDLDCLGGSVNVTYRIRKNIREIKESGNSTVRSLYGSVEHAGIILSIIASSKLPKPLQKLPPFKQILNFGDAEALR